MNLLCVHVPNFALALACGTIESAEPIVLADKPDRGRVLQTDDRAHALGARPGQTVLQACVATGGARVLVHDPAHTRAVWDDLLDALDAVSPLVEDAGEGTAFLEMRGVDGEPQQWIACAQQAVARFALPARVGIGPNKFAARAVTYVRDACACTEEEAAALLAPLPLDVLEIAPLTIERLRLLGVTTLGELARLPHGPFVRRFGKTAAAWHDCARGIDPSPFRPRPYTLQIDAAIYGEGSAAHEEQLIFAMRILAERIGADLTRAGRAAGAVQVHFECENGDLRDLETGFSQPTADPRTMLDVLRAKLEGLTFGSPITGLRLQVTRLEEGGAPATLFARNEPDPQAIAVALARLEAIGGVAVHRARVRPAHRLEATFAYDEGTLLLKQRAPVAKTRPAARPQLRMLAVREVAVQMRGNAPFAVDARKVLECAGPWRVDDGWFESPLTRDEFDVLLDDGMLCRVYRQGEHWYLRGAYD